MRSPTLKPLNNPDRATVIALIAQYGPVSVAKALANATWDRWEYTVYRKPDAPKLITATDNHYDALAKGIEQAIADYVNAGGQ